MHAQDMLTVDEMHKGSGHTSYNLSAEALEWKKKHLKPVPTPPTFKTRSVPEVISPWPAAGLTSLLIPRTIRRSYCLARSVSGPKPFLRVAQTLTHILVFAFELLVLRK